MENEVPRRINLIGGKVSLAVTFVKDGPASTPSGPSHAHRLTGRHPPGPRIPICLGTAFRGDRRPHSH